MIKIGNDYQITADKYQFILSTRSDGKDKDDQPKDVWNKTFHASFDQLAKAIINNEMVGQIARNNLCQELQQFTNDMRQAVKEIADDIEAELNA